MRPVAQFLVGFALVVVPSAVVGWLLRDPPPPRGVVAAVAVASIVPTVDLVPATPAPPPLETPADEAWAAEPADHPADHPNDAPPPVTDDEEPETGTTPLEDDAPGPCNVRLRCTDADTGERVAVWAQLWRLAIPETRAFTSGDARRADTDVPTEGRTLSGLPSGRYRVSCVDQRFEAEDPPEFDVTESTDEVEVPLLMPRTFAARLVAFDETGARIEHGRFVSGFGCSMSRIEALPPWVRARTWKRGRGAEERLFGMSIGCHSPTDPGPVVVAGPRGFELGSFTEATRRSERNADLGLVTDGRASVWCRISGDSGLDRTFVGVAPRIDTILASVRLPSGEPLRADLAKVSATCRPAVLNGEDPVPADAWRTLTVRVRVVVGGFRCLAFDWTAADESLHVLEPAED